MGAAGSRLGDHHPPESRVIWCSIWFGLFGWALVELSDPSPPSSSSPYPRGLLSGALCALFGLSLAKISNLSELHGKPPDPKEKPNPISPPAPSPDVYCSICMESKPVWESFDMKFCPHFFCTTCVTHYIAAKVSENSALIRCPEPGCQNGILDPDMCRPILAQKVFDKWQRLLCEKTITAKFYCPFKDCSAVLADERAERSAIKEAECPYCHRMFCAWCEVPWHAGVTCLEYRKLGKNERAPGDLLVMEMAKTEKWQRCPKCKFYVEKSEGCMFMKCRCGFKFCYRCGTKTVKDHYCNKCKR